MTPPSSPTSSQRRLPHGSLAATVVVVIGIVALVAIRQTRRRPPFLPRPTAFVTDIKRSEETCDVANASLKSAFLKGLRTRDWALCATGLADDFRGRFPAPGSGIPLADATVTLRDIPPDPIPEHDRDSFVAALKSWVEPWSAVERTTWRPFEFLLDPSGTSAFVSVHFQAAGVRADGTRADLSGTVRASLETADGKAWRMRRLEWAEGWFAEGRNPPWRDITDAAGLAFNESEEVRKLQRELINDRGVVTLGGLVVEDWNGDGFVDVLASRVNNEAVLFLNDGRGGFVRGESPIARPEEAGYAHLLVDLDNDGVREYVGSQATYEGDRAFLPVYVLKAGRWEPRPRALEAPLGKGVRGVQTQGVVEMDVDGNGLLDLFFCNYSNSESNGPSYNRVASYDGMDNWLFMNRGGLKFAEESDARGVAGTQFTYVAKAWDFDADGDLDVFEGNDFGPNHLWENDGKGRFRDAKEHVFGADSNYTMGVTIADWDNTGDWSMVISNMYSHAGNRIVPLATAISPEMRRLGMVLAQGNQFYERKNGTWTETGIARGVNWADWAWASLFFDADNDGDRDLFVANGYTTHEDAKAPDF